MASFIVVVLLVVTTLAWISYDIVRSAHRLERRMPHPRETPPIDGRISEESVRVIRTLEDNISNRVAELERIKKTSQSIAIGRCPGSEEALPEETQKSTSDTAMIRMVFEKVDEVKRLGEEMVRSPKAQV